MTLSLAELATLIDGRRTAPAIAARLPESERPAAIERLVWLERHGFLAAGWITGRKPLRWHAWERQAADISLLRLFETQLEAAIEVPAEHDNPLPVMAGFLARKRGSAPSEAEQRRPSGAIHESWRRDRYARTIVSGRGPTQRQAVLSCLGEAAERISATFRGDEAMLRASFDDLSDVAIHPQELLNFSTRQYAGRDNWNDRNPGYAWVPHPYCEEQEIAWVEADCLLGGPARLVPAAYAYLDYPGEREAPCFCTASSNGCASGPSFDRALGRAFLELVERDAVAIWWYNRVERPAVDEACLEDPCIASVSAWHGERGRNFHILDLTGDLAVPVCAAVTLNRSGGCIVFGFSADWELPKAALAATCEMQQIFLSVLLIEKSQSERPTVELSPAASALAHWVRTATIAREGYLMPCPSAEPRPSAAARRIVGATAPERDRIAELCARARLQPLTVDLTRQDIGIPTVRAIVPGLRHFWPRFGPGRLYDVPPVLNWRQGPCPEAALNPTPMFI